MNSPGGGAAASEEIYREVLRIRDKKKKRIVASIETVGASGAYYVSSATNKIFADNASIVGSIGVIAEWYNYEELMKWAKLQQITIKAGEFKDTGSPTRPMTPEERAYMQGLIDNMHTQFIHSVAMGRKMKDDDVRPLANGKVWTGEEAVAAQAGRSDWRFPRRRRGHGQVGGHQGRAHPGASGEGPQEPARPAVRRCLRIPSQPGQADGDAMSGSIILWK